jgi:alpha-1,6-mannosyltransferase
MLPPDPVRYLTRHPTRHLTVIGVAAAAAVVVGATRAGWGVGVSPPPGPFGLWRPAAHGRVWFATLAAVGVCVLAVAFIRLYRHTVAGRVGVGAVARTALLWCAPVLFAPPLLSLDAYSYAAQGTMVLAHLDPYTVGPSQLGSGPLLDAVAPIWRNTPAPYGPLALALLRLVSVLGDGNVPAMVYLLRLVAVLAVTGAAAAAVRLADPSRRAAAVALVAANPLVVLHLVGGVHLDVILVALAAATALAVHRGWWALAALAAASAFAVKLPGLVLVGYVLLSRARAEGFRSRQTWGTVGVVAAATAGYAALVPHGWGWIAALNVPGRIRHPYDPATLLGWLLHLITNVAGLPVGLVAAVRVGRGVTLVLGVLIVLALLWRATAPGARTPALVGGALVAVALAAPVVHAWYAVWGMALLGAAAAYARQWMIGLSVALCFTALPEPLPHRPLGIAVTIGLLAVAMASLLVTPTARAARTPARRGDRGQGLQASCSFGLARGRAARSAGNSVTDSRTWVAPASLSAARSCAPVSTPATIDAPARSPLSTS